jgi:hypothetical protein
MMEKVEPPPLIQVLRNRISLFPSQVGIGMAEHKRSIKSKSKLEKNNAFCIVR